MAHMQYSVSH